MTYKVAFSFADGKTLFCAVQPNEILLDAALRNGIKLPMDCREGVCATCQGLCETGLYSQDYVDDEALSGQDLAERKMLSCQTRVQSDAAFSFDFDSSLCHSGSRGAWQGRVSRLQQVSPNTAILHLDLPAGEPLPDYLPGQYARLRIPGTESSRAYSFANPPGSPSLQFLIRLLPQGAMSDYLRERCQVGDVITFEAPLGAFYLRHIDRPVVLVAGGTGLSALLGMLDQLVEQHCHQPVHLYYGVREAGDLCELARIKTYADHLPDFTFCPVVSQPDPHWTGQRGYIAEHLQAEPWRTRPVDLYLCGPPPMVESIKTWVLQQRLTETRIYLEKFTDS